MTSRDAGLGQVLRSRSFLAAAAGVVVLGAGGAALVALLTRDLASPLDRSAADAPATPDPAPAAPPVAAPRFVPPAAKDPAVVRAVHARQAAAPAVTRLVPSRGRFVVTRAIEQQVPELAACLAGRAPGAALVASRRGIVTADGAGVLLLELAPRDGELRIVAATVGERGAASDAELACAARALTGRALAMPGNTAGPRVTMPLPL